MTDIPDVPMSSLAVGNTSPFDEDEEDSFAAAMVMVCVDPRHAMPCPLPCAACELECESTAQARVPANELPPTPSPHVPTAR